MSQSISESLEAAYSSLSPAPEAGGEATSTAPATAATPAADSESVASSADVSESTSTGPARGPDGKFVKQEAAQTPTPKPKNGATGPEKPSATPTPAAATQAATPPPETVNLRAPSSWKLGLREKFGTLPKELQEEIARVDAASQKSMREAAEHRRFQERWNETYSPHAQHLGQDPFGAVAPLLQFAATMRTGTPQQKAAAIAQWVREGAVPLEPLAQAIDGGTPQQQWSPQDIQKQIQDTARQMFEQQRIEEARTRASAEIESFKAAHEFAEDVGPEMGVLLRVAHARGEAMTMEQAYEKACKMHPEVSGVLAQREQAKAAKAAADAAAKAKAASSSVRTDPASGVAGVGQKSGHRSIGDSLSDAWEQLQR